MKHKIIGQVYTPDWIVSLILDLLGYDNKSILDKFILEPSCNDDTDLFLHTPNKTLLYVVKLPKPELQRDHKNDYYSHYRSLDNIVIEDSKQEYSSFGDAIIFNGYELFLKKVYHSIHSI